MTASAESPRQGGCARCGVENAWPAPCAAEGHRAGAGAPWLFDMHCHLDFAPDARCAAGAARACGLGVFSVTVTPAGYERAASDLAGCKNVRVGLGLHPWWVADGSCGEDEVVAFERLAPAARFIGEVGLDFGRAHEATRAAQRAVFERVAYACAGGGKVLSIHAVKAAGEVLDVLEAAHAADVNACIFHWFSGTSDELQRAVRQGCLFSVNPHMLASKRGRAYAQAIPADRLLLETDAPSEAGAAYDALAVRDELDRMLDDLAELRRSPRGELSARIAATSRELLA